MDTGIARSLMWSLYFTVHVRLLPVPASGLPSEDRHDEIKSEVPAWHSTFWEWLLLQTVNQWSSKICLPLGLLFVMLQSLLEATSFHQRDLASSYPRIDLPLRVSTLSHRRWHSENRLCFLLDDSHSGEGEGQALLGLSGKHRSWGW